MGIVQKQSITGSVYTYLGAGLGFVVSGLLFPKFLTTAEIGLINVLVAYAVLFAQFSNLGVHNITTRLFPMFRDNQSGHHGFFGLAMIINLIGIGLGLLLFWVMRSYLIDTAEADKELLREYIHILPLLFIAVAFFLVFDDYNKVLYNSTRGIFLKEFFIRVVILLSIVGYIFELFSFKLFMYGYLAAYVLPALLFFYYLKREKSIFWKLEPRFISPEFRKELISVGFYGIFSSLSATVVVNIDRIMIKDMMGLDAAGVYSTAFFFGILVALPSRAVLKTISIYIAESWKENNLSKIHFIYQKASVNQSLIGLLLMIGLWANIDNILLILGDDFAAGYWVILLIGFTYFIEMVSGGANVILNNSKSYRLVSVLLIIMILLLVVGNWWLIPRMGIVGAAISSLIARSTYNLSAVGIVWFKYRLTPFNFRYTFILISGLICLAIDWFLPAFSSHWIDIPVRSILIGVAFVGLNYLFRSSDELNMLFNQFLHRVRRGFKN